MAYKFYKLPPDFDKKRAMIKKPSPCDLCPHGKACDNKQCPRWQMWFLKEWKKFNNYYNKYKDNQEE